MALAAAMRESEVDTEEKTHDAHPNEPMIFVMFDETEEGCDNNYYYIPKRLMTREIEAALSQKRLTQADLEKLSEVFDKWKAMGYEACYYGPASEGYMLVNVKYACPCQEEKKCNGANQKCGRHKTNPSGYHGTPCTDTPKCCGCASARWMDGRIEACEYCGVKAVKPPKPKPKRKAAAIANPLIDRVAKTVAGKKAQKK